MAREDAARKEREAVEAREKDKAHRKAITHGIVHALLGVDEALSQTVCVAIAKAIENGDIPNVSVNY